MGIIVLLLILSYILIYQFISKWYHLSKKVKRLTTSFLLILIYFYVFQYNVWVCCTVFAHVLLIQYVHSQVQKMFSKILRKCNTAINKMTYSKDDLLEILETSKENNEMNNPISKGYNCVFNKLIKIIYKKELHD